MSLISFLNFFVSKLKRLVNDEFRELFNLGVLPNETDYETLAGFVMTSLGKIPHAADQFEWEGLRFEVMDMDARRVDKVLVTTLPAPMMAYSPMMTRGSTQELMPIWAPRLI